MEPEAKGILEGVSIGSVATACGFLLALTVGTWKLAVAPMDQRIDTVEERVGASEARDERQEEKLQRLAVDNAQLSVHMQNLAEAINKLADRIDDK